MPESASAVSQIAEEEHKGEKQMKERSQKRECEREYRREKEKFERMQRSAKCLKMADVRSQRKTVFGIRS